MFNYCDSGRGEKRRDPQNINIEGKSRGRNANTKNQAVASRELEGKPGVTVTEENFQEFKEAKEVICEK